MRTPLLVIGILLLVIGGLVAADVFKFQTKEKVAGVIDTLIAAVRAGELDEHLNQAAKTRTIGKVKKAA